MKLEILLSGRSIRILSCVAWLLLLGGCGQPETDASGRSTEPLVTAPMQSGQMTLTLGDIDPDTPMHKVGRIRPLADYVARGLGWENTERVQIRIARSIDEMAAMVVDGRVDIFLDSVFPTLAVRQRAGTRLILSVVVENQRSYHALLVSRVGSDIIELEDLIDRTIAVQERYSTSGYLLPAAVLINHGYSLEYVNGPDQSPSPGRIGFFFSGDEENTLAMIRNGIVAAGALSSQDYEQLPAAVKDEILVLARSNNVPRKLASARADMDGELLARVKEIFLSITDQDRTQMGRELLGKGWRWEFEPIDAETEAGIAQVQAMIGLLVEMEAAD